MTIATTSSRTLWAVSRDGALPYSNLWMQVHPYYKMPVNAMMLSGLCISVSSLPLLFTKVLLTDSDQLYGLIFIGSTTAFSAMISAAIVFLQSSCVIPQAILLYRGRDRVLPERYFNLGRLGPFINATAVAWVFFLNVLYCIPTARPVNAQNMSYVSVVCVGLVSFVVILWFTTKRAVFKGPQIDYNLLRERREAAIHVGAAFVEVDSERGISKGSVGNEIKESFSKI